jgi:hypothetical protein
LLLLHWVRVVVDLLLDNLLLNHLLLDHLLRLGLLVVARKWVDGLVI